MKGKCSVLSCQFSVTAHWALSTAFCLLALGALAVPVLPKRTVLSAQRSVLRHKGAFTPFAASPVLKNPNGVPANVATTSRTNLIWEWKAAGWIAPGVYQECPYPITSFDVRFTVESSTDLRNWTLYASTNFNGPTWATRTRYSVPMPHTKPREFFRIIPQMVEHSRNQGVGESDRILP